MRRLDWLALVTVVAAACGGGQKAAEARKATADSTARAADSTRRAAVDTMKPAAPSDSAVAAKKAAECCLLRDSAVAPKLEMGPDGKVRPIRKPGS